MPARRREEAVDLLPGSLLGRHSFLSPTPTRLAARCVRAGLHRIAEFGGIL